MTKLAPARIAGLMMGIWFLATSVGNYIGGRVSSASTNRCRCRACSARWRLRASCAGLVLLRSSPPIKRMMGEVN